MSVAEKSIRKSGDLLRGSGQVTVKRKTSGAVAMIDPLNSNHIECSKIVPEKTMAFSDASITWLQ